MSKENKKESAPESGADLKEKDILELNVDLSPEIIAELEETIQSLKSTIEEKDAELAKLKAVGETISNGKKKVSAKGEVKVRILLPVAGRFMLPYNVNQVVSLPEKQADEIVETRYGEYA